MPSFPAEGPWPGNSLLKIDEKSMWGRLTFRPIRIGDQRFLLILAEDLSAEKRQRMLDSKYKEQLEQRVKERTQELNRLNEELIGEMAERRRSEEALRLSEARYRGLFEDAPLMYIITRNKRGIPFISDCNELFLRSLAYRREEVLGQPLADFVAAVVCRLPRRWRLQKGAGRRISSRRARTGYS